MMLRTTDTISTRQALIVGQITDVLTGRPPFTMPTISLTYQSEPSRTYPLVGTIQPNGVFSFNGDSGRAFVPLSSGATLDLRLTTEAASYESATFDFSLSESDLAMTPEERLIAGQIVTISLYDAPMINQDLALTPEPVHLAGRVVGIDDNAPIVGADCEVTAPESRPAVTTDGDGFFTIQNLPVALEITVRVTHPDFETLDTTVPLDFSQPVNQQKFGLTSD